MYSISSSVGVLTMMAATPVDGLAGRDWRAMWRASSSTVDAFEHLVFDAVRQDTTLADGNHAVQPAITGVAGFEAWLREEVLVAEAGFPTTAQGGHHGLGDFEPPVVLYVNLGAVVGLEGRADVEVAGTIGIDKQPVATAGQELAAQAGALERAAGYLDDEAVAVRAGADGDRRAQVGMVGHQRFESHRISPGAGLPAD
jgi:hypothetical protein